VKGKSMIDLSSARAILRTQFEAFLMYHYIYVNPVGDYGQSLPVFQRKVYRA
jgi:hypothetical protein